MSGAVLNNINPRLDAHALSVVLRHSESKLVFVDHHSSSLVLEALSFLPKNEKPRLVLLQDDSNISGLTNMSASSSADVDFLDTYEGVMERGDPRFKWVRPNNEWNPMVLNYTSGTTSSPKGVVLSHRAVFMSTVNSLLYWSMPNRPVYLWTLPMFHANGWGYTWATAAVGATNICVRRVDAPTIFELIDKHQVTHMCAAPMVLNMLTNYPSRKQLKRPVQIMTAGAPPPATVISSAESLGFDVAHGYGLTETGGLVVTCAWKPEWDGLGQDERARLKEVREFCKKKLPKYMVPRNVVFMEELPKTSTGKIQKFLLRQMAKSLP
ncbi:hypothetical protein F2Q69_00020913 [Brassica cretica]|uniref:AMP-dependent synthetase/ligase domain-containing protein n=1 Tax=Brassica cretica TaxID=69181 RepID=A0A8S9Q9W7_BRACR|nr:hypothetical protein F2Q69_00020913 [Brassica cretica]